MHHSIGESIETQHANRLAEYWEVLAHHYGLAEEWEKALDYRLQAGRRAQSNFQQALEGDFLPEVYRNQALAYQEQAEQNKALNCVQRSLELAEEQDWPVCIECEGVRHG